MNHEISHAEFVEEFRLTLQNKPHQTMQSESNHAKKITPNYAKRITPSYEKSESNQAMQTNRM